MSKSDYDDGSNVLVRFDEIGDYCGDCPHFKYASSDEDSEECKVLETGEGKCPGI